MKPNGNQTHSIDDSTTPGDEIPALESFPAGPNYDHLLLCGEENDAGWLESSVHVDLQEMI